MQEVNVQVAVRVSIQLGVKLRRILTNSQIIYTVVLNFNFLVLWFYAILYATWPVDIYWNAELSDVRH